MALVLVAFGLIGCAGEPPARPPAVALAEHRLGPGDRLRIEVFGEPDMSGETDVDSTGWVALKLGGRVEARGLTGRELEQAIERRLADGFLPNPHVSVGVVTYRQFFVMGEVQRPGPYAYIPGMTVAHGVAIAGGYTYRASRHGMTLQHFDDPTGRQLPADEGSPILPGDLIRIAERLF